MIPVISVENKTFFQGKVGKYERDLGFGSLRRQVFMLKTLMQGSFSSETYVSPCVMLVGSTKVQFGRRSSDGYVSR